MVQSRAGSRPLCLALSLLGACGAEPSVGGECVTAAECGAGQICVDGACRMGSMPIDAGTDALVGAFDAMLSEGGPDPMQEDVACRAIESAAEAVSQPADVLLLIDSSSSMGDSRTRIAEVINSDFDAILNASGIDYRVIVIADTSVLTIGGALAAYAPPRLFLANLGTGSGSGANFSALLSRWDDPLAGTPAWNAALRPEAVKIWLHFTDATSGDGSSIDGYAGGFDDNLYAMHPEHFGASAADGKLIYHSFTGIAPNVPPEAPYEPTAPIVSERCSASGFDPQPGAGYQSLSVRTGGLRYPVCQFDGYDNVFQRIAEAVIDVSAVDCTYALPEPPVGETLNLDTVAVRYEPGAGAPGQVFLQTEAAGCGAMGFTIDPAAGLLELCPEACAVVESSTAPDARVSVAFGCDPSLL